MTTTDIPPLETPDAHPESVEPTHHKHGHPIWWGLVLILVAIGGFVAWHIFTQTPPAKAKPSQTVKTAAATQGSMPVILNELGTVTPNATVTVVPNQAVSGYLTDVPFQEGQDIEKDQLLAQIDPRPYEVLKQQATAQLAKDQATLDQARADLARYKELEKEKSIAEQTFSDQGFLVKQDEAAVQLDQANIASYDLDIAYCHITAPVAGRVGLRTVDAGNYITGSSNIGIATITTMKPTTIEFTIAQNDLDEVIRQTTSGAKLQVTAFTSDNSKQLGVGTLYALSNQMTTSTGTVTLRASFPNDDEILFPNEFVNIKLLVKTLDNAVLVPAAAILTGAPGSYVYLVDNEKQSVSVHKVTTGPSDGTNTVITDGLAVGDNVVTEGMDRLSDGATIKTAPAEGSAPASKDSDNKKTKKKYEGGAHTPGQ